MRFPKPLKLGLATVLMATLSTQAFAFGAAATTSVNVRSGPGTSYGVVDTLYSGEAVNVSTCQSTGWCKITHSGPDGWVSAKYLTQTGKASTSDSGDAAAAAAFAAFLGLGAFVLNNATDHNKTPPKTTPNTQQQPGKQQPNTSGPNQNKPGQNGQVTCPPGQIWNEKAQACVDDQPKP